MSKNDETRKQVKKMFEGMLYHCMDMTNFMADHVTDPYFETEEGKRIQSCMIKVCGSHALGLMEFIFDKNDKSGDEGDGNLNDIEEMLKRNLL